MQGRIKTIILGNQSIVEMFQIFLGPVATKCGDVDLDVPAWSILKRSSSAVLIR